MFKFFVIITIGFLLGIVFTINIVVKPDMVRYAENNATAKQILWNEFPNTYKENFNDCKNKKVK